MDNLFLLTLNMSITASYAIVVVVIARLLLKGVPKIFSYALWSVVLFRLICPFSFQSVFSLIPVNTQTVPHNIVYSQKPQIQSGIAAIDQTVNQTINHSLPAPVPGASANPIQIWIAFGETIWLLGIAVLVIYSVFTAVRLSIKLRTAKPINKNLYEMIGINTAFVFGFIKPKIYLPTGLSESEKTYIIKHEQTHINRFDHLIKPLAFVVLCIHWFNPLVWVAFFLMSEDMELSCDESVIKQMGSEIKKDYSASLLALSTGRRRVGGCPLAFGESNTKGRIMNILNYRKPAFWVILVAIVVVVAISAGLMSNPKNKPLTVEELANQYVQEQIDSLENVEWANYKIIDDKITRLEKTAAFDHILSYPIELWAIEYRLKPDDISKVMLAGGMNEIDGWLTEDSSMGKPMLIFSYKKSNPEYLGCIWSGDVAFNQFGLTSKAGQEIALRVFLEGKGLLPHETYGSDHILVKFPLSTGETCQLLLSQPATQGDSGIWCVERWMDGNGSVYYVAPETEGMITDYFKALQNEYDNGNKPWLVDPLQVALDWINNDLGQNVPMDQLLPRYGATAEDFMQTPESHFIGYISNFKINEGTKASFHLDQIEWLTLDNAERLRELNVEPNDLPNGYYIYNPNNYPMFFQVTNDTQYNIIELKSGATPKPVTQERFIQCLKEYGDNAPPFRIVTKDGYVQSITEQYLP